MPGTHKPTKGISPAVIIIVIVILGIVVIGGAEILSPGGSFATRVLGGLNIGSPEITAENLETGPKTINYPYVVRGKSGLIRFDAYRGVNDYLSGKYPVMFRNDRDYWLQFVDEGIQDRYLKQLAENIRAAEPDRDNQVRAAISLVQNIPYEDYSYDTVAKYPYHVLYHNYGDCDEKSLLLAYLLRELEYGTAVFLFEEEGHMTAGIKAPERYCYKKTGYAFIETTIPAIPTDAGREYGDDGMKLTSNPQVFVIADGDSFEGIWREHTDAAEWNRILAMGEELDQYNYGRYQNLAQWYGIPLS